MLVLSVNGYPYHSFSGQSQITWSEHKFVSLNSVVFVLPDFILPKAKNIFQWCFRYFLSLFLIDCASSRIIFSHRIIYSCNIFPQNTLIHELLMNMKIINLSVRHILKFHNVKFFYNAHDSIWVEWALSTARFYSVC